MIRSLIILATLAVAAPVAAAAPSLQHANQLQGTGDYQQAITEYQQVIATRGYSPNVLYDLGQAQLAAGQVGHAIANLERAHVLAPRDADIDAALTNARQRAGLTPEPTRWHDRIFHAMSPREWAFTGFIAAAVLACAAIAFGIWPERRRWWVAAMIATFLVGAIAFAGSHFTGSALDQGVVVQDGTIARQSPFASASALFSLPSGESVAIERQQDGYDYVQTRTGERGWVPSSHLTQLRERIRPST